MPMTLTLMFREYCSLCHKMRDALQPFQVAYGFVRSKKSRHHDMSAFIFAYCRV